LLTNEHGRRLQREIFNGGCNVCNPGVLLSADPPTSQLATMIARARALGAVCCVLGAVMWRPVGAESHAGAYGKQCSDDTACSGTAPVCAVFFEDFSARVRPRVSVFELGSS
jgi:hypothetical protein